ncbi:MAG TPA: zf-HC2 domain-containing protein [Rhizomicrobium sp.]|nr:zf-HC2 domain-containing protein [Rhizomicrobium sp.]
MDMSEALLIAYADGELSGEESRRVEAALESRPDLRAFVERQRALQRAVESAFRPILAEGVPETLRNTVFTKPISHRWRWSRALDRLTGKSPSRRILLWSGVPAAVALACGLVLGVAIVPQSGIRVDSVTGQMIAQGALKSALQTELASASIPSRDIRIGISFKAKDGRYCRTFENSGANAALSGLACRTGNAWSIVALAGVPRERSEYRMAGGMPEPVRAAVSQLIAGEALDGATERAARDRGWNSTGK